jgi:CheY-like chemotaxis protein
MTRDDKPTVLVADDNPDDREITKRLLELCCGCRVVEAEDGLDAVGLALSERPAMILMDLRMPGLDGYEAAARIRQNPALQSVPIQDCLAGKEYKVNRGANTAFIQKIIDYATDTDLPLEKYDKLMSIAEEHIPIAQENMARKAVQMMAQQGVGPDQMGTPPASATEQLYGAPDGSQPAPNTLGGTQSQSQQLTPEMAPSHP